MESFKDKTGQEWSINLSIGTVERVKKVSRFNLYAPDEPIATDNCQPTTDNRQLTTGNSSNAPSLQQVLWTDLSALFELLCYLLDDQLKAAGIDAVEFGRRMAARCLVDAQTAFFREWTDFFRQLRRLETLLTLEKTANLQEKARALVAAKIKDPRILEMEIRAGQAMETAFEKRFVSALADGHGKLRALSESIPAG